MKFEISASPRGNPIFKFEKSKSEAYALKFVDLCILRLDKEDTQTSEICWDIWLDAKQSKGKVWALSELEYGKLPAGYLEEFPAIQLEVGGYYCLVDTDSVFQKVSENDYKLLSREEFDASRGRFAMQPTPLSSCVYDNPLSHPSRGLSHPEAVRLMQEEFLWDASDNDSPFGSDDGWQVMMDFINHIEKGSVVKIVEFLSDEFDRLALCSYQFWLSQKNEPFGFELEDGNRIVIAATFAQLMMKGGVSADLREAFQHAIKLSYLLNDFREKYLDRLRKMEDIIRQAPDLS
jgi:uncharacterized protein YfeS